MVEKHYAFQQIFRACHGHRSLGQVGQYRDRLALKRAGESWCGREDSNFHGLPRYHLKVVRLPFRHDRTVRKKLVGRGV